MLPLYLYYDDFEVSNPLSSAAGKYKIGGMYFSIPALPPKFRSMLENVLFEQFILTNDSKHSIMKNAFLKYSNN